MLIDDITQIGKVTFCDRKGNEEIIFERPAEYGLEWEVNEWTRLMEMGDGTEREKLLETYDKYSLMELQVMDEARKQMGIVFPADKNIVLEVRKNILSF